MLPWHDGNQFYDQKGEIGQLTFIRLLRHSKTDWNIPISISKGLMVMIWLHRVKFCELWSSNPGVCEGNRRTPPVDQQFSYVRLAASLLCCARYTLGSATHFI